MRGANEALDAVRKGLQGALDRKGRLELKKGLAYASGSGHATSAPTRRRPKALREDPSYSTLMTAYDLKEDFFGIYDDHPSSREEAEAAFDAWIREIPDGREFDPFRALLGPSRTTASSSSTTGNAQPHLERLHRVREPAHQRNGHERRGYSFETLRARTLYRRQNLDRIMRATGSRSALASMLPARSS